MTISEIEKKIEQVRKTGESLEISDCLRLSRGDELLEDQKDWYAYMDKNFGIDPSDDGPIKFDPSQVYAVGDDGAIEIADGEQFADSV